MTILRPQALVAVPVISLGPVHLSWFINVALRAALALLTRWRILRWYLALSVAGSVILMLTPGHWYADAWMTKGALLCVGNILLTCDAGRRLTTTGYVACAAVTGMAGIVLSAAPRWPGFWLETAYVGYGLCSVFLGLSLVLGWRDWNGRVLAGYLLLDALTLLSASAHSETIGVAMSVACICCYLAWIGGEIIGGPQRVAKRS
jgi:hypothetical protein